MKQRRNTKRLGAIGVTVALALSACGDGSSGDSPDGTAAPASETADVADEPGMSMADATSRQPAAGQTVTAAYGVLTNNTDADVQVVAASSPVSDNVQLHEMLMEDGSMSMREVESFSVPAGGSFTFESGGPHIMLLDIDPAEYPTDEVEITLEFDRGDPLTFMATVMALPGGTNHDDMDDTDSGDIDDTSHDDMNDMGHDAEAAGPEEETAAGDVADIDWEPLHTVNDELIEGVGDTAEQLETVSNLIEQLDATIVEPGSPAADLQAGLIELQSALEAGDLATAEAAATAAHAVAHDIAGH